MRAGLRAAIEVLGTGIGFTHLARKVVGSRVAILAYHNVVPRSDIGYGDASLHLPLPEFIRQIDRLVQTHDVVDLETALTQPARGRPRAVITFDDAYRGAVTLALPELVRRGLPAVVFVSPGLLGTDITWWDALGAAGILTSTVRDNALHVLAGRSVAIKHQAFSGKPIPAVPDSYGIATHEELLRHCQNGIRIGSHTWDHEYLPALESSEVKETLERTSRWLAGFAGPRSSWLALPYGGGSAETGRIALAAGHSGVLQIEGGLWRPDTDRAQVPRINVPAGISWRGLEFRTSGAVQR